MPPQQGQQAALSDDSVQSFLSLNPDQQTTALQKLSPEAKQALLIGIKSRGTKPVTGARLTPPPASPSTETNPTTGIVTPAGSTGDDQDSVLGGAARRLGETVKGAYHTFADPATPEEIQRSPGMAESGAVTRGLTRMGRGFAETEKEAYRQANAAQAEGGFAGHARAAVTRAAMLDPFATGTVVDINRMRDEGRWKEALGAGAFDAISLWLGSRMGGEPTGRTRLARLTAAVGDTGVSLRDALPEISETARTTGPPRTLGDFVENVRQSDLRVDQEFNLALAPASGKSVMPAEISRNIRALETPNMAQTAEGRETVKYIRKMAREYEKPWTVKQLNAERIAKNKELNAFYNKGLTGQIAAKSNIDTAIDKAVRDGAAEITYREIAAANPGMTPEQVTSLKKRQGALLNLKDHLEDHVSKLENAQLAREGKTIGQKVRPGTYLSSGGVHGYVSHLSEALPGGGELDAADKNMRRAFSPTGGARASRAAVLSLPIDHALVTQPQSKLPPPPRAEEDSNE